MVGCFMNAIHKKRTLLIVLLITGTLIAVGLVLYALKQNINLFYTPTEVREQKAPQGRTIRVGGMVKKGSVQRGDNLNISFSFKPCLHLASNRL